MEKKTILKDKPNEIKDVEQNAVENAEEEILEPENDVDVYEGTKDTDAPEKAGILQWIGSLACGEVPVFGWIYLLYLSFSKKKKEFNTFARAWLIYKTVLFVVILVLLVLFVRFMTPHLEALLDYIEML